MISDANYVDYAEKVIKTLGNVGNDKNSKNRPNVVTTTQIRNLLSMTAELYDKVNNDVEEKLSPDILSQVEYLRIHFVYQAGREPTVKTFVKAADILPILQNVVEKKTKKELITFCRYMEALVAFRKYHIGNDKN